MFIRKISILVFLTVCIGCVSNPSFTGKGDICGIVVDENNKPVNEFAVYCINQSKNKKSVLTNESGIFVFHDMNAGVYKISGTKTGYSILPETEYNFANRNKIFCCQIMEINSILDTAEKMILLEEYDEALNLLNSISLRSDSNEEKVVNFYKNFILEKRKGEI